MTFKIYLFRDEQGRDVTGYASLDIGDKIINANGEWTCIGKSVEIQTTKTISILDKLFHKSKKEKEQKEYFETFILKRIKK